MCNEVCRIRYEFGPIAEDFHVGDVSFSVRVEVDVASFDCDNRDMNRRHDRMEQVRDVFTSCCRAVRAALSFSLQRECEDIFTYNPTSASNFLESAAVA